MSVSFRRPALLAAAVVAAVTLAPAASFAGSYVHSDPTGDMVTFDAQDNTVAAPDHTNIDVTRLGVAVGQKYLKTRLTFAEMKVDRSNSLSAIWFINTNEGKHFILSGYLGQENRKGDWQLMKASGPGVRCSLTHTVDYVNRNVLVQVPVGCLSTPSYVRVGAGVDNLSFVPDESEDSGYRVEDFADDSQKNGLGDDLTMSPRIKRN